jgi:hypothetical protein
LSGVGTTIVLVALIATRGFPTAGRVPLFLFVGGAAAGLVMMATALFFVGGWSAGERWRSLLILMLSALIAGVAVFVLAPR